jgi:Tol biopolymer transport system component
MRSGKWIVYMDDRDDGHAITASDLYCISVDGRMKVRLTATPAIELTPQCSPTENLIVCSTLNGEILLLRYEEGKR